jgi:hypothetical protein
MGCTYLQQQVDCGNILNVTSYKFLGFFGEALPNVFSENGLTREAPKEGTVFYYGGEEKKVVPLTS